MQPDFVTRLLRRDHYKFTCFIYFLLIVTIMIGEMCFKNGKMYAKLFFMFVYFHIVTKNAMFSFILSVYLFCSLIMFEFM